MSLIKKIDIKIWGRDFSLKVEYDCFKGETVTNGQNKLLDDLLLNESWIEESKKDVEKFCKKALEKDETNNKKDNMFSYVKPDYIFVKRDDKKPRIAIMCKYKYDIEHGIAVVFSDKGEISVGIQDIIL